MGVLPPVNLLHIFRTTFPKNTSEGLLLNVLCKFNLSHASMRIKGISEIEKQYQTLAIVFYGIKCYYRRLHYQILKDYYAIALFSNI